MAAPHEREKLTSFLSTPGGSGRTFYPIIPIWTNFVHNIFISHIIRKGVPSDLPQTFNSPMCAVGYIN